MYPLQESFPPTYSEIISSQGTAVPVRKGEFSDDEDMGRNVPPVDRVSVNRDGKFRELIDPEKEIPIPILVSKIIYYLNAPPPPRKASVVVVF